MSRNFDLLGHPIPDNHGKPGANGHVATPEKVNKVRLLLAAGWDKKDIAQELGISQPTLSKHYFQDGSKKIKEARRVALADQRARNILRLDAAAEKGNVSAIKALHEFLHDEQIKDRARDAQGGDEAPKPEKPLSKGKKEELADNADRHLVENPLLRPGLHS